MVVVSATKVREAEIRIASAEKAEPDFEGMLLRSEERTRLAGKFEYMKIEDPAKSLAEIMCYFSDPSEIERLKGLAQDQKFKALDILSLPISPDETVLTWLIRENSDAVRLGIFDFYLDFHTEQGKRDVFLSSNRDTLISPLLKCMEGEESRKALIGRIIEVHTSEAECWGVRHGIERIARK